MIEVFLYENFVRTLETVRNIEVSVPRVSTVRKQVKMRFQRNKVPNKDWF